MTYTEKQLERARKLTLFVSSPHERVELTINLATALAEERAEVAEECAQIVEEDTRSDTAQSVGFQPRWFVYAKERAAVIRARFDKAGGK